MSQSTINTELLKDFVDNSIHDMFILTNNISDLEKKLDLIMDLCLKLSKYNNTYVLLDNNSGIKKTSDNWKITGYEKIIKSIEIIKMKVDELNGKVEMLDPLISNIDSTRDELDNKIDEIEDVLSKGLVVKEAINNNFADNLFADNITIDKSVVVDSINNNFVNNRKLTDNFNQELYKRVNEEIINLSNDFG